ncbi:unnamed protein product [Diamesa serratosioi]
MALVLNQVMRLYYHYNNEFSGKSQFELVPRKEYLLNLCIPDQRVKDFFLMSNPFPTLALIGGYLYFVLKFGPKYMEHRKAMKLDGLIKYYNLLQVIICLYLSVECYRLTFANGYSLTCQPVDFSLDPKAVRITRLAHYYFLIKIADLFDTVFFVLRKKSNQVTFLHVYHHAGMVALTWSGTKYFPGGHSVFMGLINTVVHVFMYLYYFMTSVDNKYKQSSWKKQITQMQMIQFGAIALHWLSLFYSADCGFPKWIAMIIFPQNAFMFVLFYDFYRKAYRKKPSKKIDELAEATEKKFMDVNNNLDDKLSGSGFKSHEEAKKFKEEAKKFKLSFEKTISG